MNDDIKSELRNIVLIFMQVTRGTVSEQIKLLADITEEDEKNSHAFYDKYIRPL